MLDLDFKFQTIFDYMDHPVYISDPETYEILYFNKKIKELVPRIKIGEKCYKTLQGNTSPCSFCTNDKLFGENSISPYIWEHYNEKLGKWYHCTDQVILWKGNQNVRFELAIDITELKNKENKITNYSENLEEIIEERTKELKESEEKFRTIAEQSFMAIGIIQDAVYQYFNKKAEKITGYTFEEVNSWEPYEFMKIIHPDYKDFVYEQAKRKQIGDKNVIKNHQYQIIKKTGEVIWLDNYSTTIQYKGKPAILVMAVDITENRTAQYKLKESEEKYKKLVENAHEGIWALDENENTIFTNPRLCEMLGYTNSEMLGKNLHNFIPDSMETLIKGNRSRREIGLKETYELQLLKKDGTIIYTEIKAAPIFDENQKYAGSFACITDITEKKEAEQIILKENQRLLQIDKMRQELITRISHELKTPLTSIYGIIQILMNNDTRILNKEQLLEIGYKGSVRLKDLIDNLLDSSRFDIKNIELKLNKENLSNTINDCINELAYFAKSRNIILESDIPQDIYLEIDILRFSQVIINIISNAIKYTPPKGLVFIRLIENQDAIYISVEDTGIGITAEEKKGLFQKFGKIERYGMGLDLDTEGAGLGLYISKEIIELHGGQILVESEGRNKGSRFIIKLIKNN